MRQVGEVEGKVGRRVYVVAKLLVGKGLSPVMGRWV